MTGSAPLQYGQQYHIYNRGNNREDIFIVAISSSSMPNTSDRWLTPMPTACYETIFTS